MADTPPQCDAHVFIQGLSCGQFVCLLGCRYCTTKTALNVHIFNHFVQVLLGDLMPVWPKLQQTNSQDRDKDLFHFVIVLTQQVSAFTVRFLTRTVKSNYVCTIRMGGAQSLSGSRQGHHCWCWYVNYTSMTAWNVVALPGHAEFTSCFTSCAMFLLLLCACVVDLWHSHLHALNMLLDWIIGSYTQDT